MTYYHHPETTKLVALLPEDWRWRWDPYSIGQQFLNPLASRLADVSAYSHRHLNNLYLETHYLDYPRTGYIFNLQDYVFQQPQEDPRQAGWRLPTVTATLNNQTIPLTVLTEPDQILSLLPQRITFSSPFSAPSPILNNATLAQVAALSPVLLSPPSPIYIITNLQSSALCFKGKTVRPQFRIAGINAAGQAWAEVVTLQMGNWGWTRRAFQQIQSVRVEGLLNQDVRVTIGAYNLPLPYRLDFELSIPIGRDKYRCAWQLDNSVLRRCYLTAEGTEIPSLNDDVRMLLVDEDGDPILPLDIAPIRHRPWIAVLTAENLYLYSKFVPYPSPQELAVAHERTDPCLVRIHCDNFWHLPGENLYCHANPQYGDQIGLHYSWSVAPPGGSFQPYRPNNGILVPTSEKVWIAGYNQQGKWLYAQWSLPLNTPGYWRIRLDAMSSTGCTSTDTCLVGAIRQHPLKRFILPETITPVRLANLRQQLLIVDNEDHVHPVNFHYDAALINIQQHTLFCWDQYDSLEIT